MNADCGAIILCGGRSRRMGRDKALLPFGPNEALLQRMVRIVAEVVPAERLLCVAAANQELPELLSGVRIVRDQELEQGPLAALVAGLSLFGDEFTAVFVCGCDSPFLSRQFIERMFEFLGKHQVAAPSLDRGVCPLPAVYRSDLLGAAKSLLAAGERSLKSLVERCDTRLVSAAELRHVDPDLAALRSCNTPQEYESLLARDWPSK